MTDKKQITNVPMPEYQRTRLDNIRYTLFIVIVVAGLALMAAGNVHEGGVYLMMGAVMMSLQFDIEESYERGVGDLANAITEAFGDDKE